MADPYRLLALDPATVAVDTVRAVARHLAWSAIRLSPAQLRMVPDLGTASDAEVASTDLGLTIQSLTAYAQRGAMGDWPDVSCVSDAIQSVCEALYVRPLDGGTYDGTEFDRDGDPDTAIGLVLLAAECRRSLSEGEPVTTRGLAALAGLSDSRVRQLVVAGDLRRVKHERIRADDAKRWLSGRGTLGYR